MITLSLSLCLYSLYPLYSLYSLYSLSLSILSILSLSILSILSILSQYIIDIFNRYNISLFFAFLFQRQICINIVYVYVLKNLNG